MPCPGFKPISRLPEMCSARACTNAQTKMSLSRPSCVEIETTTIIFHEYLQLITNKSSIMTRMCFA